MPQGVGEFALTVVVIIVLIAVILFWRAFSGPLGEWVNRRFDELAGQSIVVPIEDYMIR